MAALIVAACGILLETGLRATVPPDLPHARTTSRGGTPIAAAPVVVAADQKAHYGHGDGADSEPVPDRARLDASLVTKAASAPGARTAVADITFPAKGPRGPLTAHNWSSTTFTGDPLTTGRAPGPGEVALAQGTVGDQVTLTTPDGTRAYRISGTTEAPSTVWFTDSEALRLSGHPGRIDAVAVLPEPGVATDTLAAQVTHAVGRQAEVHTGDARGAVEDPTLDEAKEVLTGIGGSFGGIAAMVAVFTAAGTVALAVGQRAREFALLRAVGATPARSSPTLVQPRAGGPPHDRHRDAPDRPARGRARLSARHRPGRLVVRAAEGQGGGPGGRRSVRLLDPARLRGQSRPAHSPARRLHGSPPQLAHQAGTGPQRGLRDRPRPPPLSASLERGDPHRELGTLHLIGSTRRQVLRMIRWEALLVALAGIVLGTAIALATLVPMMKGLTGEGPYIPPLVYGAFAGAIVVLGLTAVTLPARAALRGDTLDE